MGSGAIVWAVAWSTFRRRIGSLLAFSAGAAAFQALVAVSFPAIGGMDAVTSVVQTFPEGLRSLLKLAPNLQAGFGLQDYLAFSWIHPVFLGLGAAFVVSRATDALAGEIERGSIYLALSRPVPRWTFVTGKALEMFASVGIFCLMSWLGMMAGIAIAGLGPLPLERFLLVALVAWPLFGALGAGSLAISSAVSRTSVAGGLGYRLDACLIRPRRHPPLRCVGTGLDQSLASLLPTGDCRHRADRSVRHRRAAGVVCIGHAGGRHDLQPSRPRLTTGAMGRPHARAKPRSPIGSRGFASSSFDQS